MRLVFASAAVTVALSAAAVASAYASSTATAQPLLIFALAGQSNMSGNDQIVPLETADPDVYDVTFGQLRPAIDPLGDAGGFGPGRAIGAELARLLPGDRIGLVMCAQGSTQLDRWVPGGDLYQRCVQRVLAAQASLGGTVAGMFFGQGENDAERPDWASSWAIRFTGMVPQFRTDVGAAGLPVVFSQLGVDPTAAWAVGEFPLWDVVRGQQATVDIGDSRMIVTSDIPSDVHYDWDGYQQLGVRYADAWLSVTRAATVAAARTASLGSQVLGEPKNLAPFTDAAVS